MATEKNQKSKSTSVEKVSKFPSEVIDLPSGGKIYGKDSPLYEGKLELKYMTAKDEDILTSQNLIKKGTVIDTLLNSLIVTSGVTTDNLILGDKNAVMIAARILAYGPEYTVQVTVPTTGEIIEHTFDLSDCPFKKTSDDIEYSSNSFEIKLPLSGNSIKYRILTGKEEKDIEAELKAISKLNRQVSPELTTRLKYSVIEVDGESDRATISNFVDNMLSRDSFFLRKKIQEIAPDIDLTQEIDYEGETVKVDIPMTVNFFWPDAGT